MKAKIPSIVLTGASGFVGNAFLDSIKEKYLIYAIARRSRKEAQIPYHKNIHWIQCDIANKEILDEIANYINDHGGADYVVHLAAYYDFTYLDNEEYQRTNVLGTENILDFAKKIEVKRFIFASSLAACKFPHHGNVITEKTPPDADNPYARSKKAGEELVRKYSEYFPCSILRFAAVYSDWCEFAPLYKFLSTWLSRKLDSRIIGGKGKSAVPYIHIQDLCNCLKAVFKQSDHLSRCQVYNASPDGSVTHRELFEIATRYYFGESIKPIGIPKIIAYPAILVRKLLKYLHLTCHEPFERFWMIRYIDLQLTADASYTRNALFWKTTPRYHITRRLLFILEKMKSHPDEWKLKNEAVMKKVARRANLSIYEYLQEHKELLLSIITSLIESEDRGGVFERYKEMDKNDFSCYIGTLYNLLMATVRSADRGLMLEYIDDIAIKRFAEGFEPTTLNETLQVFNDTIIQHLLAMKEFMKIKQEVYDYIGLTIQLAQDAIEDLYDKLIEKMPAEKISESALLPDCKELQKMIRQLSAFYQISPDDGKYYEDLR